MVIQHNLKLNHDMNEENAPNKPEDSSVNSVGFSELLADCKSCGERPIMQIWRDIVTINCSNHLCDLFPTQYKGVEIIDRDREICRDAWNKFSR